MDGGAGLNILYASTLEKMRILRSRLNPTGMTFHGVAPSIFAKPLGQISLDVVFGKEKNFRKESLSFEVVDFKRE